jgi:nicotinate phosphoribosyltransferase
MTKTAVFSDNLNFQKADYLAKEFKGKIKVAFGIGTFLTNDTGILPISIVIKMTKCNGQAVAKLSDCASKNICRDKKYVEYLKSVFKYK